MKSIEARLESLERAAESLAAETIIRIQLISVASRAELLALEKLRAEHPEPPRPPARGRIKLELLPTIIIGAEVLAEHGIFLPADNDTLTTEETPHE